MNAASPDETERLFGKLLNAVEGLTLSRLEDREDRRRDLRESEDRIKSEARASEERIKEQLAALRHQEASRAQVVLGRLEMLEGHDRVQTEQLAEQQRDITAIKASMLDLKAQVETVKTPIDLMASNQRRRAANFATFCFVVFVVWALIGATVADAIKHFFWLTLGIKP